MQATSPADATERSRPAEVNTTTRTVPYPTVRTSIRHLGSDSGFAPEFHSILITHRSTRRCTPARTSPSTAGASSASSSSTGTSADRTITAPSTTKSQPAAGRARIVMTSDLYRSAEESRMSRVAIDRESVEKTFHEIRKVSSFHSQLENASGHCGTSPDKIKAAPVHTQHAEALKTKAASQHIMRLMCPRRCAACCPLGVAHPFIKRVTQAD